MTKGKLLLLIAAGLSLASVLFPYWTVKMKAPSYPEKALTMQLYSYKYEGDIEEWNRVGRLVGVHMPPPIPDFFFRLFPVVVIIGSIVAFIAAAWQRWLTLAAIIPWLILVALMAYGQYELYLYGHNLDPARPLRYFDSFTPPVVGVLTLGKIQTYHFPDIGSLLLVAAGVILLWRAWLDGRLRFLTSKRKSQTT